MTVPHLLQRPASFAIPATAARFIKLGVAAAIYAIAALMTLPPAAGDQFHYGFMDSLLVLYMLEWTRYAIFAEPQRLFEGLAFYGMGDSLLYHHTVAGWVADLRTGRRDLRTGCRAQRPDHLQSFP